jgi:hypothetical protein
MQLNDIKFGNPNRQHLIYLSSENYLDSLLPELSSYPFPPNESLKAKEELELLTQYTDFLANDEKLKRRFELYDLEFESYMTERVINQGGDEKEVKDLIIELHKDIVPLLVKLKFDYNRPRPYQLAYYIQSEFHPFRAKGADSPSYPSGHCYQSAIYAEVLGSRFPHYYQPLQELATDIMWSRQYMGVHFPTDSEFSLYIADLVLKHPDFRKKYKL